MRIKNAHGNNGSGWLKKYRKYFGIADSTRIPCCVFGCGDEATDGAHVWKCDANGIRLESDQKEYIAPMCHGDNLKYGQDFDTIAATRLAPLSEL